MGENTWPKHPNMILILTFNYQTETKEKICCGPEPEGTGQSASAIQNFCQPRAGSYLSLDMQWPAPSSSRGHRRGLERAEAQNHALNPQSSPIISKLGRT